MDRSRENNILGVCVSDVNLELARDKIDEWIKDGTKVYVCVAPVSTIVDCQRDEQYHKVVNKAAMVTPDGMPTVWIGRLKKYKNIERTYGPDFMLKVCEEGQFKGYRHYFYGGAEKTLILLEQRLKERLPDINIVGKHSPPFRKIAGTENEEILDSINGVNPDILWVGLGSPKQDFWMHKNRDKLNVPVMIGVGAAFDFLAGTKLQAPRWMRDNGFEWLFRLVTEPRRLWKRYLIGNSIFLWLFLKEFVKIKVLRKKVNYD
ncbi:MAG: WecB/TagA/CpsF family glycosyltransferase [Candidatus Omnitrophica bacterium]|nr:WecB/TagA/CpsF family glycosyltransferase [Candidatus Omnitrophota bacterium]